MAITSESERGQRYGNSQFRYGMTYMCITFVLLLFLNIYCSTTIQRMFYQSKEASMIEKSLLASSEIAALEVVNPATVAAVMEELGSLKVSRLIVTNSAGAAVYDSAVQELVPGSFILLPEIAVAMEGNDVFSWRYHDGALQSRCATPVFSYGTLVGCVYMMEYDTAQGKLVQTLQSNLLTVTVVLEIAVIAYSLGFSSAFSRRFRQILASMQIIRRGDYSHRVDMGGHDELTLLGDEFNDLTSRLQTSENKRRQFVSDASHELKTPLASIKLLTDSILQNDMDVDTIREFVGDIGSEADRLNRMSQKLLSLSRIESQSDGDCEIIYMAPTVERVARMLSGIAENSGIEMELDLKGDCPILILEDDLYQIAFNLAENGIKYNTPGGRLTISLLRDADNALLKVCDSGVGIPEDAVGHLFERFYRVDKARSRSTGGSGLGLAIVKNLVERNQGQITVQSVPGEGTCFTVTFPAFDTEEVTP